METLTDQAHIEAAQPTHATEAGTARHRSPRRTIMEIVRAAVIGLVALLLLGNLLMLAMHAVARSALASPPAEISGVDNLHAVDERVWRGAAPSRAGYIGLASSGVRTVVDLRAEDDIHIDNELMERLGIRHVRMPIRDGQIPSRAQVDEFLGIVASSRGKVFVHCGAGVGRTGSMSAAYLVATGQADGWAALRRNLAVGPPSLEQVAFVASLDGDAYQRPRPTVVAISRFLDAPRRLWSRYGF